MPAKLARVAIYLRVSKDDGSRETDNQLLQVRDFCKRWEGHELVVEAAEEFLEEGVSDFRVVVETAATEPFRRAAIRASGEAPGT